MRTTALALAAGLATAKTTTWDKLSQDYTYESWLAEFSPVHTGSKDVFEANLAEIMAHNANPTNTWKMGVNKFSGLTKAEFKHKIVGHGYSKGSPATLDAHEAASPADLSAHVPVKALPASVDWRTKGVVTKVKDQGGCGGCWSFSAAETLESHIAIKTGKLFTFSEQQLIDCTPNPDDCGGTGGCSGATQELAFNYTMTIGSTLETDYPYKAVTGTCNEKKIIPVANITGYATLPFNNYTALMNAVVNIGPIAISAAAEPWMSYETGVFSSPCGTDVDHAIVLEGYGTDSSAGLDYYLVRNSWGEGWGEAGYIRIARYGSTSKGEPCGTDNTPGDGDGCNGGPASIQVCGLCGILSDSSYPEGGHLV